MTELMLCDMGLSVRAFTVLRREGYETTEDVMQNLPYIAMTVKKTCKELCEKLHEHGFLQYNLGHWITDHDDLGEPIAFDELEGYVGKLVLTDLSTESKFACKVVMPLKILENDTDGRSVLYYDGSQTYGRIDERYFTPDKPEMYRIKSEPTEMEENMTETKPTVIVSDDYSRAVRLTKHIAAHANAMQESLYEVCKGLKEMRDGKLYKELGYQNFEEYTENEVGIGRHQARNLALIAEGFTSENVESIQHFGTTKLALLAKLDPTAREEIQQTVNIEETSVKELKAQIVELKKEKKELETRNQETEEELERSKTRTRNMVQKNVELVKQIEELEQRPVEVAVAEADTQELERLNGIIEQKSQEIDRIRSEYEIRLQNAEARQEMLPMESADTRPAFRAYLANAVDALKRLTDFMETHRSDANADMYRQRINEMLKRVEENV